MHLSSEQMEVLRTGCGICNAQIHIVTIRRRLTLAAVRQRQEPFNVRTAMVRAGPIKSVR